MLEGDKRVVSASKSAAVRITTAPVIDFRDQSESIILEALAAASLLDDFATRATDVQLSEIYSLPSE